MRMITIIAFRRSEDDEETVEDDEDSAGWADFFDSITEDTEEE